MQIPNASIPELACFNPEKNLLAEVLARAIRDLFSTGEIKRDARRWLISDEIEPMSFRWVCHWLDLCPCQFRKSLFVIVKTGRPPIELEKSARRSAA